MNNENNNFLSKKNTNKNNNLITSLVEVENFLKNLQCIFSSAQFIKLFKKFK